MNDYCLIERLYVHTEIFIRQIRSIDLDPADEIGGRLIRLTNFSDDYIKNIRNRSK